MNKMLITTLLAIFAGLSYAQEAPSVFLEHVANDMIVQIEKNKEALKTDDKLAVKLVKSTLLPAIDTHSFARKTLTRTTWKTLSKQQQERFITSFINLVVGNYATGLSLYNGQRFEFSEAVLSKTGKLAKVRSSMRQDKGAPIIIDYVLSVKSGTWKIIDLTIEGVTMSKSYKNQFLPRIKSMGIETFLEEMESKKTKKG